MAQDDDTYDYDEDLDDEHDTLQFGKYATRTPRELLDTYPGYLVWCWESTTRWVGSETLIRDAYAAVKKKFKPRATVAPKQSPEVVAADEQERIEAFEQAVYDTWGCFPKPTYAR